MFTLKMKFNRFVGEEPGSPTELADESTEFVLADKVIVHSHVAGENWEEEMKHWETNDYGNLLSITEFDNCEEGGVRFQDGCLITAELNGKTSWFLTSHAWLLSPDGKTIERLV